MVAIFEVVFLVLLGTVAMRWYLRTPLHRARKRSGVGAPLGNVAFLAHQISNPTPPPRSLRDQAHRVRGRRVDGGQSDAGS
jgi:hypothetical protein